jgi:galactokinase
MRWAAYIGGCLVVLATEEAAGGGGEGGGGVCVVGEGESLVVLVSSDVPEGKGVSSSASVEVATMSALAAAYGASLDGRRLALLCQKVENLVVGAPCGIMDQMASALGQHGALLALLCQPAEVQGCVAVPPHARVWGIDSGQAHSVGGADYGSVRVGAFMGLRIAGELLGGGGAPPALGCHLASLSPSEFEARVCAGLPLELTGAEFLEKYGDHRDAVTTVDPGARYAVRVPSAHPVHEHFRVRAFRQALLAAADTGGAPEASAAGAAEAASGAPTCTQAEQMSLLGELMFQSHASYSACGLGSAGTDRLVALVQEEMGAARARVEALPVFGAKITGGGSGGTVCILAAAGHAGDAAVRRVASAYASELGYAPKVFQGSSMGAVAFGALTARVVPPLP